MSEQVAVESYSGHTFAERPIAFLWDGRRHLIEKIIKQWRSPEGPGFRVVTADGLQCDLTYHDAQDEWSLRAPTHTWKQAGAFTARAGEDTRASQPSKPERKENEPHA